MSPYFRRVLWPCLIFVLLTLVACSGNFDFPADLIPDAIVTTPAPTQIPNVEQTNTTDPSLESESANQSDVEITPEVEQVDDGSIQGRLAIVNQNGRLMTMSADGSESRQVSTGRDIYRFPSWSPTSDQIAVIGEYNQDVRLLVFDDVEENEPIVLYDQRGLAPIYLYWHPEGESVSFIANSPSGLAFYLEPADGSGSSTPLNRGQPFYWQWLANGKQALVHVENERLAFMDLAGEESITGLGSRGSFQTPALSSRNRYLAYQELRENGRFITIKDLHEDQIALQTNHQGFLSMGWNPNTSQLAYVSPRSDRSSFGPLFLWDATVGEEQLLTNDDVIAFFWSPDGRTLAYLTAQPNSGPQAKVGGAVSQQRQFITLATIDIETGAQRYIATFEPNPIFVSQFLPFFEQYALSHRIWSPDSRALAIPVINNEGEPEILITPIDGQDSYRVSDGFLAFWSHQ